MKYISKLQNNKNSLRPPDLYEYFADNFWFESVDLNNQKINEPLRGSHKADVVIIGGGYTGLSAAYNLRKKFPNKKIVLLEGACCGYGASGRNGGFCVSTGWLDGYEKLGLEDKKIALKMANYGQNQIKEVMADYGVDCEFEETGQISVAMSEKHIKILEEDQVFYKSIGLDSKVLGREELKTEINSPIFLAGIVKHFGAILNPMKLAREMKRVVEEMGVEVREQTIVTRIEYGKTIVVDTELGDIKAPEIVIATNAYSHKLGFLKNRVIPVGVFQIATEPLSDEQWASIGWKNRQGLSDERALYHYSRPTADGRIVTGGVSPQYYENDQLTSGNDKIVSKLIEEDFFKMFPQLEGLKIDHAWGGTTALTLGNKSSIGVMGDYKNIYYGVGYYQGVPATQTGGRIIAELMTGEENDFTNHFVVNQNIPYAGPRVVRKYFSIASKRLMEKFDLPMYR